MKYCTSESGEIRGAHPVSGCLRKIRQLVRRLPASAILILIGALTVCLTDNSSGQDPEVLTSQMENWLHGADRNDFPWKIELLNPRLTYQQRYLVEVQATVRARDLKESDREWTLIFAVAVRDGKGQWIREVRPTPIELPPKLDSRQDIFYSRGIFLHPGDFGIAVVCYDSRLGRVNVRHLSIRIPPLKNDPLSNLKIPLPEAELIPNLPGSFKVNEVLINRFGRLAMRSLPLPVENTKPVMIDFVINVGDSSAEIDASTEEASPNISSKSAFSSAVLQAGNFLSQVDLKSGCVRASIVDLRRMQVMADRQDPRNLKWGQLEESLLHWDHTIDVASLQNRYQQSIFLYGVLKRITNDFHDCQTGARNPEHIVAIISSDLQFPDRTVMKPLDADAGGHCRFYYLYWGYSGYGNTISMMLKGVHPRKLRFDSPQTFRKAGARFLADIAK